MLACLQVSTFVQRLTNYTDEEYKSWLQQAVAAIPMGEVCTGEDIAKIVVHVASEHSRLVTGTVIPVDGGLLFGDVKKMYVTQQIQK